MLPRPDESLEKDKLDLLEQNFAACTGLNAEQIEKFLNQTSTSAQLMLAPSLRKTAIAHLRKTKGKIARADFHDPLVESVGENHQVEIENLEAYLEKQAKDRAWAEDNEAIALGEVLGCNIVVTYKQSGKEDSIRNLHKAAENAPTIQLFNRDNKHWYADDNTIGDGNCLYNAASQRVQKMLQKNRAEKKSEYIPEKLNPSIENTKNLIDNNSSTIQSFKSASNHHKEIIEHYSEAVRTQTFFGITMDSLDEQGKKNLLFSIESQNKEIQKDIPAPTRIKLK